VVLAVELFMVVLLARAQLIKGLLVVAVFSMTLVVVVVLVQLVIMQQIQMVVLESQAISQVQLYLEAVVVVVQIIEAAGLAEMVAAEMVVLIQQRQEMV
jgi:hypothetical protein